MLHFDDAGTAEGEPMVMVHGFLSSNAQWERNVARLGRLFRLVLVELPGHGRSPAPHVPDAYGPAGIISELEAIRSALDIDRWWLVGHSLGGAALLRYALEHPDVARGLIFTNSRAAFGAVRPEEAPTPGPRDRGLASRDLPFHPANATRFPRDLKERMVAAADAVPPHVIVSIGARGRDWRSSEDLQRLQVPVLVVNGRWERAFQPCVDLARREIPDLEVVDLDGGHSINIEQSEGFDRAVIDFTRRRG